MARRFGQNLKVVSVMIIICTLTPLLHITSREPSTFASCSGVRLTTSPDVFQVSLDSSFCLLWCLLWLRTQACLLSTKNSKSRFCTVSRVNVLIISCIIWECDGYVLPARPNSIGKWPPGYKEKHEQLLRTTVGSKLCGMLRRVSWEVWLGWSWLLGRLDLDLFSFPRSCWLHYNNGLLWSFNAIAFALISVRTLQRDKTRLFRGAIEWASWPVGGRVSEWVWWVSEWVSEWVS